MPIINQIVKGSSNAPTIYIAKKVDQNGLMISGDEAMDLSGVKKISYAWGNSLYAQFAESGIIGPAFKNANSLEVIEGVYALRDAFYLSTGVTSTELGSVKTIQGDGALERAFYKTSITTTGLTNLEMIDGTNALSLAFVQTNIVNDSFPKLWRVYGNGCLDRAFPKSLVQISFPRLNLIYRPIGTPFPGCENLEHVYLGGVTAGTFSVKTTQLQNIFYAGDQYTTATGSAAPNGCTLHFPTNFDPTSANPAFDVTTLSGYPTFGGDAQYIHLAYDLTPLPELIGVDTNLYDRMFVNDTDSALCWHKPESTTKYYTSGTSIPSVGDTIYSDAACTTAVTTIDSINQ